MEGSVRHRSTVLCRGKYLPVPIHPQHWQNNMFIFWLHLLCLAQIKCCLKTSALCKLVTYLKYSLNFGGLPMHRPTYCFIIPLQSMPIHMHHLPISFLSILVINQHRWKEEEGIQEECLLACLNKWMNEYEWMNESINK